jgi:hypothetical protein
MTKLTPSPDNLSDAAFLLSLVDDCAADSETGCAQRKLDDLVQVWARGMLRCGFNEQCAEIFDTKSLFNVINLGTESASHACISTNIVMIIILGCTPSLWNLQIDHLRQTLTIPSVA